MAYLDYPEHFLFPHLVVFHAVRMICRPLRRVVRFAQLFQGVLGECEKVLS
jgi:hypothetical protein